MYHLTIPSTANIALTVNVILEKGCRPEDIENLFNKIGTGCLIFSLISVLIILVLTLICTKPVVKEFPV